jgi:hypothetical protein
LLDNAVLIRQRMLFITLAERYVCLQCPRQLDVVTKALWSLARLKPVISLYQWFDPLLYGRVEASTSAGKLRAFRSA